MLRLIKSPFLCLAIFTYLLTFVPFCLSEDVYSWKDEDGNLVFGNNPPEESKEKKKVKKTLSTYSSEKVFKRYKLMNKKEKKKSNVVSQIEDLVEEKE